MSPARSIGTLVEDIIGNIRDLVRSEIRLAWTELRAEGTKARYALGMVAVGLFLLALAAFTLIQAAIDLLEIYMPPWGACCVVGAALVVMGAITASVGAQQLFGVRPPQRAAQALRESVEWAKHHTN